MSKIIIPVSHHDLVTKPGVATLSTLSEDQSIQSSLVWFDFRDGDLRINTPDSSAKAKNLTRHPKATLLIMDSGNVDRYISLRCEVRAFERNGAISHLDSLTKRNMNLERWYGGAVDDNPAEAARRVIICLKPVRLYTAV
jgi:PPOX class probable F420-dependent enzyme